MKNNSILLSLVTLGLCVAFTYAAQLDTPDINPVYFFSHGIVDDHNAFTKSL